MSTHHYKVTIRWTGNKGEGTRHYRGYGRDHSILIENKKEIAASSDPAFRGDPSKHNPEELFLSSLSSCHMLWFLHLCADEGIVVTGYVDHATGTMTESAEGGGHFTEVTLHPLVTVLDESMIKKSIALHEKANAKCFIANSVNFTIRHKAVSVAAERQAG